MILADANISIDKIRSPDYETDEVPDYNTTQLAAVECLSKLITDCGTEFTNIYSGFLGKKSTTQNLNKLLIENSETDFKILNQEFYTEKMAKNLESQVQSKNTKGQKNAKRITESNLPVP